MSVCMVEYQGRCDENSVAVGHSPKVLEDYYNIISGFTKTTVYAPRTILRSMERGTELVRNAKVLPGYIPMKGHNSLFEKINNKFKMFHNVSLSLKNSKDDVVWFFNVEFYLMLYLAFHKKPKQKIVCTLFIEGYKGGIVARIKQKIFEMAQKKMDVIIASGVDFKYKNCKYVYIPDYAYDSDKYDSYKNRERKDYAVCLGTMNRDKEMDKLVECFNRIGYPLRIAGRFYDKEWFQSLKEKAADNVEMLDTYLSTDEYLSLLSEARYSVLPYRPDKYGIQTSGVVQESAFLGAIPVSYDKVLAGSNVYGIGFESFDDLTEDKLLRDNKEICENQEKNISEVFDKKVIEQKYKEIFS